MSTPTDASQDEPRDGEGRTWMKVYFTANPPSLDRLVDDLKHLEHIRQVPFHQRLNRKPWER